MKLFNTTYDKPKNGGLTWMNRITTDKDTTKSIKAYNQMGESIYCSNYLFLSAFILFIHVKMLFIEDKWYYNKFRIPYDLSLYKM